MAGSDNAPAESGHKHKGESKKHSKGEGEEHHEDHHDKGESKGVKEYKGEHHYHKVCGLSVETRERKTEKVHSQGEKGHHDKEGHKGQYSDKKGSKKAHKEGGGHFEAGVHGEKGQKDTKHSDKEEYKKGHSTRGGHVVHKKDEYEKKHEFYDEHHEGGEGEKHGEYFEEHHMKKGGHKKGGHKHGRNQSSDLNCDRMFDWLAFQGKHPGTTKERRATTTRDTSSTKTRVTKRREGTTKSTSTMRSTGRRRENRTGKSLTTTAVKDMTPEDTTLTCSQYVRLLQPLTLSPTYLTLKYQVCTECFRGTKPKVNNVRVRFQIKKCPS